MLTKAVLTAVSLTALSTPAMAQGFSGGELTLDAYAFAEGSDPTGVNYSGALEYSLSRNFSVAGAVSVYDFSLLSESVTNVTLHGIYHVNDQSSVGLFLGNDSSDSGDASFFGLEGGFEANQLSVEGYAAIYDDSDDSTVVGISGDYRISDTVSAIGTLGFGDVSGDSYNRLSAGAEYDFQQGPSVYAEVGQVSGGGTDSGFIGIGASIEFGAARGTTFDRRGIFETINPGF